MARVAPFDIAYLAGFFDGEGCVCINYQPSTRQYSLRLQVTQSGRPATRVLSRYVDAFGGRLRESRNRKSHWKRSWVWSCQSLLAKAALTAMLPWLDVKWAQAHLALEFQKTLAFKGTPGAKARNSPVRASFKAALEAAKRED